MPLAGLEPSRQRANWPKRVFTYKGYTHMWSRHLKSRSMIALRDFRTVDGENLLRAIARTENLNRTSLAHLKAFLSGAFRYARRQGILNTENPMRDVVLPKARPGNETHAYFLEHILRGGLPAARCRAEAGVHLQGLHAYV